MASAIFFKKSINTVNCALVTRTVDDNSVLIGSDYVASVGRIG